MERKYITGQIDTPAGKIPVVSTNLDTQDILGAWKIRFSIGRMGYIIEPGLYAAGNPTPDSPVFVSANYKLSFDILRRELSGINSWILVIDTKGINVWCAAGKGTFGTEELAKRIVLTSLGKAVNHRKVIVPQLGATGVSAHEVKRLSGFKVIYGPVRAPDISAFLKADMKATPEMRKVNFTFKDRLTLVPVELAGGLKYLIFIYAVFFLLSGLNKGGYSSGLAVNTATHELINLIFIYLAGTTVGPLLLPLLPGRAFALKGFFAGMILFVISFILGLTGTNTPAWFLIMPAVTSFMVMGFTGASTYTSLSGVIKEMRIAIPLQLLGVVLSTILFIRSRFI
jgi:hypothetical protein